MLQCIYKGRFRARSEVARPYIFFNWVGQLHADTELFINFNWDTCSTYNYKIVVPSWFDRDVCMDEHVHVIIVSY